MQAIKETLVGVGVVFLGGLLIYGFSEIFHWIDNHVSGMLLAELVGVFSLLVFCHAIGQIVFQEFFQKETDDARS